MRLQNVAYNGHKRHHGIKNQSVTFPNGMIGHFSGPWGACRHDSGILTESGLLLAMQQINRDRLVPGSNPYCLYGDPAYPVNPELIAPHRGVLTPAEHAFNTAMSESRVSVEWGFGRVQQLFPYLAYKDNLKVWESPIQRTVEVAVLLTNINTIYYGAGAWISFYGEVSNLTIAQYLG